MELNIKDRPLVSRQAVENINKENGKSFGAYRMVAFHPTRPTRLVMAEDEDGEEVPRYCAVIDNLNSVIECGDLLSIVCKGKEWTCSPKFSIDGGASYLSISELSEEQIDSAYRNLRSESKKFPSSIRSFAEMSSEIASEYFDSYGHFDERSLRGRYWLKIFLNLMARKINLNEE